MSITTGQSAVDNAGDLFVYVPPNVTGIDKGFGVVNGNYQQITAGAQADLAGLYQFANGSGALQALGPLSYRVVTITAGPPPSAPAAPSSPQTTRAVGLTAAGGIVSYVPPNALPVPTGSQVSYGPWVELVEFDALPNTGLLIIDVAPGGATVQAMNLVLIRTVTLVPL